MRCCHDESIRDEGARAEGPAEVEPDHERVLLYAHGAAVHDLRGGALGPAAVLEVRRGTNATGLLFSTENQSDFAQIDTYPSTVHL